MSPEHISGQCLRRNIFGKVWSAKCSSLLGIQIILLRFETIWLIMNCSAMTFAEKIFLRKTLHRQLQPNSAGWDNSSTMYFGRKAYMGNISRQLCRSVSADRGDQVHCRLGRTGEPAGNVLSAELGWCERMPTMSTWLAR